MIRLIACDIDGTLLLPGQTSIAPVIFEEIRRLNKKGVRFCPNSGRRPESLRRLFAPVAERLYYICENGASVFRPDGALLGKTPIARDTALYLAHRILALPDSEVMISGIGGCYLCPKSGEVVEVVQALGNDIVLVRTPEDIKEDILKVSAFCPEADRLAPQLEDCPLPPQIAGPRWVDFTLADKATGLRQLGGLLGIAPEEMLAIGDNYNDVGMLEFAGNAWLMASAAPELLSRFPQHCRRVEEVLQSL